MWCPLVRRPHPDRRCLHHQLMQLLQYFVGQWDRHEFGLIGNHQKLSQQIIILPAST